MELINKESKINNIKRESNLELLRLLSMFLVLVLHYIVNIKIDSSIIHSSPLNAFLAIEIKSLSVVCVNCFILISGYFGIRWKIKSILELFFQILFWLFLGFIVAKIFNLNYSGSILSVFYTFFNSRWFIPAYLCLYIFSPILNSYIDKSSSKQLLIFLLAFYSYSTIVGWFLDSAEFNKGMSCISLMGLYFTGAYIRKSDLKIFSWTMKTNLLIYFGLSIILSIICYGLYLLNINISIQGYLNPIVIFMSIYLFLFFQKLNIGKIKWINYLAASVLAVYLFHQHPSIEGEFYSICKHIRDSGVFSLLLAPTFLFLLFFLCILIDKVRFKIFKFIFDNVKITNKKGESVVNVN